MNTGIIIVVGMTTATVASSVAGKILNSVGKMDEAAWVDFATKCGVAITALTTFGTFIKAIMKLG